VERTAIQTGGPVEGTAMRSQNTPVEQLRDGGMRKCKVKRDRISDDVFDGIDKLL
jgi:hypothetical protein